MNRLNTLISITLIASAGSISHAQTLKGGWTICTRDLQLRETLIEQANERELTLINAYGIRSVLPMDQVLFIVKSEGEDDSIPADQLVGAPLPEQNPVRLITLVDGQTVRGSLMSPKIDEHLAITMMAGTSVHGDAHLPLERILRISDQHPIRPDEQPEILDDLVVLRNGDRLAGFIESLGPQVQIALDDSVIDIDFNRIDHLYIANDPEPVPGMYLQFEDEEVLRAMGFRFLNQAPIMVQIDPDSLGLEDTGNTDWRFESETLTSILIADSSEGIVPLVDLESRVEPIGDREWAPLPRILNARASHPAMQSIDIPSPAQIIYALPEGARRFASIFETPLEIWTDCVVRVIVEHRGKQSTLFEQRLNHDQSSASINIELPRATTSLVIEVDPGEHGPIQDRVIMHRPRLLVTGE